jgi:hypothetical protein
MVEKSTRVEETAISPQLSKEAFGNEVPSTDVGAWGRLDGAQGVLTQPEWVRGCEHT